MWKLPENGIVIPPVGGGIGYFERDGASESADLLTAFRSLVRTLMSVFL